MTTDVGQLRQVLGEISSSDNSVREQAERVLEDNLASQPDGFLYGLCTIADTDSSSTNRSLAAIIFRRTIGKFVNRSRLWHTLTPNVQIQCSEMILKAWSKEDTRDVRNKLGDAVAEVARLINQHEEWPQLLQTLWNTNKDDHEMAISALRILAAVPECISNQKSEVIANYLDQFLSIRESKVHLAAIKALHSTITMSSDDRKIAFSRLIVKLPQLIVDMAKATDEDELLESLQSITEMGDDCPKLFRNVAITLGPIMISIVDFKDFNDETKKAAVELLTTLVEILPGLFKKNKESIKSIVTFLLKVSSDYLGDGDEWYTANPDDELEEESLTLTAEQSLDRVAIALGGASTLSTLMSMIPSMIQSSDWRHRYAALRAIANIAEGCADLLEDRLEELLTLVWPSFNDSNPRVQYAACHALGQLCTDFAGKLQERFAPQCLSNLVGLLTTSSQPRVQCHAAAALINFAEGVDGNVVAPILDSLLARLISLLGSSVLYLQEQVLATTAAFSSAAGQAFVRFMSDIMPLLINCLSSHADKSYRLLQSRALEAATLIAHAVGKESFAPYSQQIITIMVGLQQSELDDDDHIVEYLASAWVRMCQVLGSDFVPFISLILPKLLTEAAAEPDIAVIDAAEPGAEDEYDPTEWEFATIRGKRLGIHTATLESKCAAVENISIYIATLGAYFIPYVPQTFEILLPLVCFNMHEGVQSAAAEALASLIKHQMTTDVQTAKTMAEQSLNTMLEELGKERDSEVIIALLDSVADIISIERTIDICPANFLSCSFDIINTLLTVISRHQSVVGHKDEDEDEDIDTSDDDESVMYAITRFAASLFKNYHEKSLPFAETLLQFCIKCIMTGRPALFKHASVCVLDDLVHWIGMHTAGIRDYITKCLGKALTDEDNDTRQAAIYGTGMCSEHAPTLYEAFCIETLPLLLKIIDNPDSKASSVISVTDNAMAAVARICNAFPTRIDLSAIIPHWITGLPVNHDEEEAPTVYAWLLTIMSRNPVVILGPNGEHRQFILDSLKAAFNQPNLLPEPLRQQVASTVEKLGF